MSVDPLVVAGLVSGIGNIAGGLFGSKSQSSANATNLQIARETNESNLAIARETNRQQMAMLREQQRYNSPVMQRRMMEAAGYNPYSLYVNGSGSAASSPSAPALHAASQYAPTMIPEDALGHSIGQISSDMANLVAARASAVRDISEAKNIDQDTINKRIEALTLAFRRAAELKRLNIDVDLGEIQKQIQSGTMDAQIKGAELTNKWLDSSIGLNQERIRAAQIENFVNNLTKLPMAVAELKKVLKEAALLAEKGLTEQSQRLLNEKIGDAAVRNAAVNEFLAPSQSAANYGAANYSNQSAALSKAELKLLPRKFASQYVKDINAIATGSMTQRELASRAAYWSQQAENMNKSGKFIYPKEVLGLVERIGNLFKQLGGQTTGTPQSPISFGPTNGTMGVVPY